jgi:hypothetical protein
MFKTAEGLKITDGFLPQTPENIRLVYRRAGYTQIECGNACGIDPADIMRAEFTKEPLSANDWFTMLRVCNKRHFDHESIVEG